MLTLRILLMIVPENSAEVAIWILSSVCALLLMMVGFFLKGVYVEFKKIVQSVQHIERTVAEHGAHLRHLMGSSMTERYGENDRNGGE